MVKMYYISFVVVITFAINVITFVASNTLMGGNYICVFHFLDTLKAFYQPAFGGLFGMDSFINIPFRLPTIFNGI